MRDEKDLAPLPFPARRDSANEPEVRLPDVYEDAELNALLKRFTTPPVPESLDVRVVASYRALVRRRRGWRRVAAAIGGDIGSRGKPGLGWRRPVVFGGIVVALVAIFLEVRGPQPLSAAELLLDARASEQRATVAPGDVLHQVLSVEERTVPNEGVVSRRRVELWSSPAKGLTIRRIYNERGQVLEGEWVRIDGSRTRYRRGVGPVITPPPSGKAQGPEGLDHALAFRSWSGESGITDVSRLEPTVTALSAFIGRAELTTVSETKTAFIITSRDETSGVSRAALTLGKPDLQPITLTLQVRRPDRDREYRLTLSRMERLALAAQPNALFLPDSELEASVPSSRASSPPAPRSRPVPAAPFNTMYVEALRLLHEAGACLSEQGTASRTPDGALQINAIVRSDARKDELLQALRPLLAGGVARVAITTPTDAMHELGREAETSVIVRELDVTNLQIPAYDAVRQFLVSLSVREVERAAHPAGDKRRDRSDGIDEEVRAFANDMLTGARTMLQHAWALRYMSDAFSQEQVERLAPAARMTWYSMVRDHARALDQETEWLRSKLEPVFFGPSLVNAAGSEPEVSLPRDLAEAVAQLFELSSAHERTIRSAFVVSEQPRDELVIGSAAFHTSLRRAEALAVRVQSMRP